MKKTKLLIGTMVLSMGLMGTGYAYWTKQLTVTSTVSSANFDVYINGVTASQKDAKGVDQYNVISASTNNQDKASQDGKGDAAIYTWTNIYPGSEATFIYNVNSESTIPVKATPTCTLTSGSNQDLAEALVFIVNGVKYNGFSSFKAAMEKPLMLLEATSSAKISSTQYRIVVSLPTDVTNVKTIKQLFGFTINMNWQQFNDNTSVPSTPQPPSPPQPPTPKHSH